LEEERRGEIGREGGRKRGRGVGGMWRMKVFEEYNEFLSGRGIFLKKKAV
jgi:hypothetical protein